MSIPPVAFLDLETTGLDPIQHEIIELAVVYKDGSYLEYKVKPEHLERAQPKALEVNGYSPELWQDALTQQEAAIKLGSALNNYLAAGQNVKFDLSFVTALSRRTGIHIEARYGLDTVTLAYEHLTPWGLTSLSMKNVCEFIGIPPEPDVHRALNGARTAQKVFNTLLKATLAQKIRWKLQADKRARNAVSG